MYRGTTPTHIFKTKTDLREAVELFITYKQNGKVLVEKSIGDVNIEEDSITTTLTQEETLSFDSIGSVEMQIRVRFEGDPIDKALASNIIKRPVGAILKEGVI